MCPQIYRGDYIYTADTTDRPKDAHHAVTASYTRARPHGRISLGLIPDSATSARNGVSADKIKKIKNNINDK